MGTSLFLHFRSVIWAFWHFILIWSLGCFIKILKIVSKGPLKSNLGKPRIEAPRGFFLVYAIKSCKHHHVGRVSHGSRFQAVQGYRANNVHPNMHRNAPKPVRKRLLRSKNKNTWASEWLVSRALFKFKNYQDIKLYKKNCLPSKGRKKSLQTTRINHMVSAHLRLRLRFGQGR